MIVAESKAKPVPSALADLRTSAMSVPADQAQVGLAEYKERRDGFRSWLLEQLVEGLHFGYPPGCEPKWATADGRACHQEDAEGTLGYSRGGNVFVPFSSWRPKPSMYAAGVDFIVDLMNLRVEYSADLDGWRQIGSKEGVFVYCCKLYSKQTGEQIGDGRGVHSAFDFKGNLKLSEANKAVKMSMKSAKMCAVLDAYGLRDLFTQDMEDAKPTKGNPTADETAPTAPTRGQRREAPQEKQPQTEMCAEAKKLWNYYRSKFSFDSRDKEAAAQAGKDFRKVVAAVTGRTFDLRDGSQWQEGEYDKVMAELKIMEGGA